MTLNGQYIGEEIDCEALGVGRIVEINESTVTVATDFGLAEFDLSDIELDEEMEDLEELSLPTLNSYATKRSRTAFSGDRNSGESTDGAIKRKSNQINSLSLAKTKMNRIRNTGSPILSKEETEIEEGQNQPYVKKHTDSKGNHAGWKASNKHGKVKYFGKDFKSSALKHAGLNEENLEELSKKTLGSYIKKSVNDVRNSNLAKGCRDQGKYFGYLYHKSEEENEVHNKMKRKAKNRETGIKTAAAKLAKEQFELEEGRGRKPKQPKEGEKPTAAWLRHLERQKGGQEKEEIEALGSQLRKAVSINKPVTFANGEKKEISNAHADKFHDHMAARKMTADKLKFQQTAHASHDAFMKAITSPIPG